MKKGFTLIELLAVIVILAIIALIATPVIINIINDANESAQIISAKNILIGAKNAYVIYQLKNNNEQLSDSYIVTSDHNLCPTEKYNSENETCESGKIELEIDSTQPVSGYIDFEKNGSSYKLKANNLKLSTGYYCNGYEDNIKCSENIAADGDDDEGCILEGTKITMADGTLKNIEDIKPNELVLSYDHHIGKLVPNKVITVLEGSSNQSNVIELKLENGNVLNIVDMENIFDINTRKYILVTKDNYKNLVGMKIMTNLNGKISSSKIVSTNLTIMPTKHYTIYSDDPNNYIASNIVVKISTYYPNSYVTINDNYILDYKKYNSDIKKYGLYTYDDVKDYVSYEIYNRLNVKFMKFLVAKKLITEEEAFEALIIMQKEIDKSLERFN